MAEHLLEMISMYQRHFSLSVTLALVLGFFHFTEVVIAANAKQESKAVVATPSIKPQAKPIEVKGEVVDAWCYASQTVGEGRGEKHKECALYCARGGVALGILEDSTGNMYIAGKHKGYQGCQQLLLPYVGKQVVAKGWVGEKGGCRILKIMSVKPAGK